MNYTICLICFYICYITYLRIRKHPPKARSFRGMHYRFCEYYFTTLSLQLELVHARKSTRNSAFHSLFHDLLGLDSTVAHHLLHDVDALISLHNAAAIQVEDSD